MKIIELLTEWKRPEIKDIVDVPYDLSQQELDARDIKPKKDPRRGPHAFKELNLMLKGLKPAALVDNSELLKFRPYIPEKFTLVDTLNFWTGTEFLITLKGEEWRGRQLKKIWPKLAIASERNDQQAVKKIHAQIGMLLGYPKEAVRFFIDPKNKIS